ncbi:MAG: type I-U CRISPR-associated protein Cas8c [Acidobacteriota bacterium]
MNNDASTFKVQVDVTNPGQFFACCGLLELVHRLWPGSDGGFAEDRWFVLSTTGPDVTADIGQNLVNSLRGLLLTSLSQQERQEREFLEAEKRRLKKQGRSLPEEKEERRRQLGEQARGGSLHLDSHGHAGAFSLLLDWWQREDDAVPKTWAGLQEIHKVARAAQDALSEVEDAISMLDYCCVLRMSAEYWRGAKDGDKSVEPFYFDARRFSHALDAGFSLDRIGAETVAYPAVELLALIGLQRFRPIVTRSSREPKVKAIVEYCTWHQPIGVAGAAAAACGSVPVPGRRRYSFKILARDDQKRYGAFGWAGAIGELS